MNARLRAVGLVGLLAIWGAGAMQAQAQTDAQIQSLYETGLRLMQDGRYGEAADAFQRVVQAKPDATDAHVKLGIALAQLGRQGQTVQQQAQLLQAAADRFGKAAELNPKDQMIWLLWSETLVLAGDLPLEPKARVACYQGAAEKCSKAAEISPREWSIYNKWAAILASKMADLAEDEKAQLAVLKQAETLFGKAAERTQYAADRGLIYQNWAGTLNRMAAVTEDKTKKRDLYKQALDKCERAVRALPNTAAVYNLWGSTLIELGKVNQSRTEVRQSVGVLAQGIDLDPNNTSTAYNLARAQAIMGASTMAILNLRKCFKLDKQNTFRAMAATDEDFSNLRGIAEFDDLVAPQPPPSGTGSTTPPKP